MSSTLSNSPKHFSKRVTEKSTLIAVVILAAVIFTIDAFLPLGVAGGVPYVAVILVALRSTSARLVYSVAAVCSGLTLVDIAISPGPGNTEWWKVIVNRFLAMFAIWVTALLGRQRNVAADIQRRHLAELAHLSRTKTAECLAGSLAHELNQPLAAVALQAEIAGQMLSAEGKSLSEINGLLKTSLREITEQSHRASMIVRALRDLVRRTPSERQLTDLNALIHDSVRLIQTAATQAGIELHVQADVRLPLVGVDRIQIQQVILNLLQNAVDALMMSNSGERLVIVETRVSSQASQKLSRPEIVVVVSDSGPGFSAEQRARLFEPFSSTKPHGLGLGLNISRSIIESHNGRLSLLERDLTPTLPTSGTQFAFTLPCSTT